MPLTVSEKEHWRERIDKKIAAITSQHRHDFQRLQTVARERAIAVLGLTELLAEQQRIEHDKKTLEARETEVCRQLLAEHEVGQEVLKLRLEKENLLDTVFLATSPTQVRTLWQQVSDLLGDELSQLQKAAMQISPSVE